MKKYALFVYNRYYPYGGFKDFQGSFDTVDEARDRLKHVTSEGNKESEIVSGFYGYNIVDTESWTIIIEGDEDGDNE